ncbi:MAG: ATP-binding protein [Rhodobacteraceae bacterium]|nr:ATP-binding protein [Paracoccaceae bacterium]
MRLVPRSLAGQLTMLLLLALAVMQGVAAALFALERVEAVRHAYRDNVIIRTVTVIRLLEETPSPLHEAVVVAASARVTQYWLTEEPAVETIGTGEQAAALASGFAVALDALPEQVRIAPLWTHYGDEHDEDSGQRGSHRDPEDHDDRERHSDRRTLDWFTASLALPDGRWLNVAVAPPRGSPWGQMFLLATLLSAIGIAVVAVLMARRIAKPMRTLAEAAGRFGKGEAVDNLREAGPAEMRQTLRAFNLMRERLDLYVRDRTAMLASISHDLRTPITSIRLLSEFVEDRETKARIESALDEMQQMTDDALLFIRDDMRSEQTRRTDMRALVDSVAADLEDIGHEIEVEDGDRVLLNCRPILMRRALRNLLENAAVYGSRAKARLVREDRRLQIVIEDEGPGIPEAELERVLEPFVRLDQSRSRETGGSGLGLAIARTIVRSHGGTVKLENRDEGGLRATVSLPGLDGK